MNEPQLEPPPDESSVGVTNNKLWRSEAVIRLLLGIFICIYAGSVVMSAVHFAEARRKMVIGFLLLAAVAVGCLCTAVWLMRRPNKELGLEQLLRWAVPLGAGFFLGSVLGLWAQKVVGTATPSFSQMLVSLLSFQGAALLLIARFVKEHQLSWNDAFGFSNHQVVAVLFGLVFACIFLPIGLSLQTLSFEALKHVAKAQEQQAVQTFRLTTSLVHRLLLGILTVGLVPVTEECLFRGILYPWIKKAGFPKLAFWGTSFVFAVIHLNLMTLLPLFVLALILTGLYEKTNNLLAPIAGHALFNAANLVMLYVFEFSKPG